MFRLSPNNSRPKDIVPISTTVRTEKQRKLEIERDDYIAAYNRAMANRNYALAACYMQMALAIDDTMKGLLINPHPCSPSFHATRLEEMRYVNWKSPTTAWLYHVWSHFEFHLLKVTALLPLLY